MLLEQGFVDQTQGIMSYCLKEDYGNLGHQNSLCSLKVKQVMQLSFEA